MMLSTIFGLAVSVVAFGTLVVGDPTVVITMNSAKVTSGANEYFDPWVVDIVKTKRSSQLNVKLPTKMQLPDSMQFQITVIMEGQEPIEYTTSLCDALSDEMVGKSLVNAGVPKDQFPKQCPFGPGDWSVEKWDPPTAMIPPGLPDGRISGSIMLMEEGKEPAVKIDYDGQISHSFPGLGR